MEIAQQVFTEFLQAIGPLGAAGWAIAAFLAQRIWSLLREEKSTEERLRTQIEELHKINADIRVAAAEERVEDLRELNKKYEITSRAILAALKKIGTK